MWTSWEFQKWFNSNTIHRHQPNPSKDCQHFSQNFEYALVRSLVYSKQSNQKKGSFRYWDPWWPVDNSIKQNCSISSNLALDDQFVGIINWVVLKRTRCCKIDFSKKNFKMFFAFWLDWIHYRNLLDSQVTVVMNISTENVSWFRSMLLDVFSQVGLEAVFSPSRFLPEGDNKLVSTDAMKSHSFHSIFFAISSWTFLYFKTWRFYIFNLSKMRKFFMIPKMIFQLNFIEDARRQRDNDTVLLPLINDIIPFCHLTIFWWLILRIIPNIKYHMILL